MCKKTLLFALVFCIIIINSQVAIGQFDRIDDILAKIGDPVSSLLDWKKNIDYWEKNRSGVWERKEPKIINTQVYEVSYDADTYYGLFVYIPDGHYRYPNIMVDWVSYNSMFIYIFKKEYLDELKELVINKPVTITIPLEERTKVSPLFSLKTDYKEYASDITASFRRQNYLNYELKLCAVKLRSGEEDIVRFVSDIGSKMSFIQEDKLIEGPYYETSLENFNMIFPCK
ncbi:MAG: hypothetical protein GX766_09815 [Firmicutes bacterium]|nr:hypothetical protein [Bacillota bacterium]